ncbi:MAG TPA: deoxyribonuclease IV [Acidimicrobiales bacterium]|nr:deoxyribonuclease IV [Acidimicrobiales bacterium]
MLIGAQVRQTGGFLAALHRGEAMGAEVVQLFPQNNRQWRPPARGDEVYAAYRDAAAGSAVVALTVCHAPYLINVISPDLVTRERSFTCLVDNLRAATALGAIGLVVHPGSHRGVDAHTAARRVAREAVAGLDAVAAETGRVCDLLLENTAGAGGTVGRTFSELAEIIAAAGGDPRVGVCVDTQHLWASGISFATAAQADRVVSELDAVVGLDRLRCLHLNDSKVPFGANRDRHENLGEGTIGRRGLAAILGHPDLQGLPAVLEVKGIEGHGPGAADLVLARSLHARGRAARRRAESAARRRHEGRSVPSG